MKQEVYQSSTLGPIPLSFTGRRLLQNLREAMQKQLTSAAINAEYSWERISEARGELAQYMSRLERENERLKQKAAAHDSPPLSATLESVPTPPTTAVYNLPAIPPGYSLTIIGGIVVIEPFDYEGRK